MNFDFLFGAGRKEELAIVLDVGNASVGGALVFLSEDKSPTIIYSVRKNIPFSLNLESSSLLFLLGEAVHGVLENLARKGMLHSARAGYGSISPSVVYCVFATPWYTPLVRRVSVSQETPFEVSPALLSSLLLRELKVEDDSEAHPYLRAGVLGEGVVLIEKETVSLKVNGYEIREPFLKEARELQASFYLSIVPEEITELVSKNISRFFHIEEVRFHSFTLALWNVIRDTQNEEEHFLILDVTGEVTEISLVRHGVLRESVTVPFGRNFFLRNIMNLFGVSAHEASSLLNLYFREKGWGGTSDRVFDALERSKREWFRHIAESLRELSRETTLPQSIFLTADSPIAEWLRPALQSKELGDNVLSGEVFGVTLVGAEAVSPFSKTVGSPEDIFLSINSIFAHKMHFLK